MKKQNLILSSAIALAFGISAVGAHATTTTLLGAAPAFAKELLQGSTPAATALTIPAAKAITVLSNVAIPANSTVYVYVKLSAGAISTMPSVAPGIASATVGQGDGTGAGAAGVSITLDAAKSLGSTTGSANPGAVGATTDYLVFQLNTVGTPIGVGTVIATIGGAATGAGTSVPLQINNAASLTTTPITVTSSVGIGAAATRFGALPAAATSYDATSAATTLATSAQGVTLAAAAATTTTALIDLTTTPSATGFTGAVSANTLQLGTVTATNGSAVQADGATAYTVASQTGVLSAVVTAPVGFFAPLSTTGQLWLDATSCAASAGSGAKSASALGAVGSTVFTTAALAAAASTATVTTATAPVSGTVYGICMGIKGDVAAVTGTPTVVATVSHASSTTDSSEVTSSTNLLAVSYNGQQVDVQNYIPQAVTGYQQTIRVINTGSVAATPSIALVNESTGVAGTPVSVGTSIPAGGSLRLSQATIEGLVGVQAASARPRLRITASTNGMKVQSFFNNANGAYTNLSGQE